MNLNEIPFLSATELARLIEGRSISSTEVVAAYLERIGKLNDSLCAYITVCGEQALDEAKIIDASISKGNYIGPLHGLPVAVKDQFYTNGIRTTAGSDILSDFVPDEDATVVSKLKEAGAIIIGKLNMSEFAMGDSFYHPAGIPRNPWDISRNPGMSSSGSAVATAAFMCASSLGEDTGGSTRIPAAWTGLVGLRPTWGLVSRYGVIPVCWSMDIVGPISRTVEDCAITLQAIAGYDPKDSYSYNGTIPDYRNNLTADIRGVRVGLVMNKIYDHGVDPEISHSVMEAGKSLEKLGAKVEELHLPLLDKAGAISKIITDLEGASLHYERVKSGDLGYDHNSRIRIISGAVTPAYVYYKAQKLRQLVRNEVLDALRKVDILAMPTSPTVAPKIATRAGISSREEADERIFGIRNYTGAFNLSGVPAIAVPCGFTKEDLPISLQLAGRPFRDDVVLAVAHAYESVTPWHDIYPKNI